MTTKKARIDYVNIIGAGLAGSEAALFLANNEIKVNLFEMKPHVKTPAHKSDKFAELVCSNSLKSTDDLTASGLLKRELEELDCNLLKIANMCKVSAGSALAVDRENFSNLVTETIKNHRNINVIEQKITVLNLNEPTIIATGPLTDNVLYKHIQNLIGEKNCYFYDAIAPIVFGGSVNKQFAFWGNRYGKGNSEGDYLNCPLSKDEYTLFYNELINGKRVELKDFEKFEGNNDFSNEIIKEDDEEKNKPNFFEGCLPVEIIAKRGFEALRFGPMKPVGLFQVSKEKRPYAVLQLRKEDEEGRLLNLVGFQTNLIYSEQKRIFSLIPALENAEYIRFGQMHRNSYINSPACLNEFSQLKKYPNFFIAGQLSGVEGYVESIASGLFVGYNMLKFLFRERLEKLPSTTCLGAMMNYISNELNNNFQPINANYGIMSYDGELIKDKKEKKQKMKEISINEIKKFKEKFYGTT